MCVVFLLGGMYVVVCVGFLAAGSWFMRIVAMLALALPIWRGYVVYLELQQDPTSHNLWPIDFMLCCVLGVVALAVASTAERLWNPIAQGTNRGGPSVDAPTPKHPR